MVQLLSIAIPIGIFPQNPGGYIASGCASGTLFTRQPCESSPESERVAPYVLGGGGGGSGARFVHASTPAAPLAFYPREGHVAPRLRGATLLHHSRRLADGLVSLDGVQWRRNMRGRERGRARWLPARENQGRSSWWPWVPEEARESRVRFWWLWCSVVPDGGSPSSSCPMSDRRQRSEWCVSRCGRGGGGGGAEHQRPGKRAKIHRTQPSVHDLCGAGTVVRGRGARNAHEGSIPLVGGLR